MKLGTIDAYATSSYGGGNWAAPDPVYRYTDSAGNLAIVTPDLDTDTLAIDTFAPSIRQRVGATRSISLAGWPNWGGFYAGPDGCFYVLVGRNNPSENDSLDVVAVRRYDRNWTLLGTAYVQGGATQGVKGIYSPFDASAAHMVLVGNRLVVHMGRLIYEIEGLHHQVNLTFEVNVDTMKATTFGQVGGYAYSSHSFQQLVGMNGGSLVMIDHGDAYPRAIQMGVMAGFPTQRQVSTYRLFDFNGAIGDNFTGATVTGLVTGPSGVVVVGNSVPHPNAPNGALDPGTAHNVYAIWADPATGAHRVGWLTNFAPHGSDALEPRVVQVGTDRYAVLFSIQSSSGYRMEYRLIDSAGTVLASESFPGVFFSAISDPILIGKTVYWAGVEPHFSDWPVPAYLFGIDVSSPTTPSVFGPKITAASFSNPIAYDLKSGLKTWLRVTSPQAGLTAKLVLKTASGDKQIYSGTLANQANVEYWLPGWDGKVNGQRLPSATYDWVLTVTKDGISTTKTGKVIVSQILFNVKGTSKAGVANTHTGYMVPGSANVYVSAKTGAVSDTLTLKLTGPYGFAPASRYWGLTADRMLSTTSYFRDGSAIRYRAIQTFKVTGKTNVTYAMTVIQ